MRTTFLIFAAALCTASVSTQAGEGPARHQVASKTAASTGLPVLPPGAKVEGVSFGQWTARWWQWALSQPIEPYLDPDGRLCELGQEGPVWFLAGTDGSFTAKRKCIVPGGKYLLVPVINMIHMYHAAESDPDHTHPCSTLQARAAVNNDHLVSAVVLIDGVPLADVAQYRVRSDGCFALDPQARVGASPSAAADGYWLLLKPLSPGRHTLSIGANYGSRDDEGYGHMQQNFEYVLDVGGRTDLALRAGALHVEG